MLPLGSSHTTSTATRQGTAKGYHHTPNKKSPHPLTTMALPLSTLSILFFVLVVLGTVVAGSEKPVIFAIVPLLFVPPGLVLWRVYWRPARDLVSLDMVVRMFAGGFLPGAILASIAELILGGLFMYMIYGDALRKVYESVSKGEPVSTTGLGGWFSNTVSLLLTAFIVAGGVEETMKLAVMRLRCCSHPCNACQPVIEPLDASPLQASSSARITLVLMLSASLGFSTLETILYSSQNDSALECLVVAGFRSVISLPLHSICAAFTAFHIVKDGLLTRQSNLLKWIWAMRSAILIHGAFDAMLFLAPSLPSETAQLLVGMLGAGGILVVSLTRCVRMWRQLFAQLDAAVTAPPAPARPEVVVLEMVPRAAGSHTEQLDGEEENSRLIQ